MNLVDIKKVLKIRPLEKIRDPPLVCLIDSFSDLTQA